MKVWYLPIESYQERYTELLTGWTVARFKELGVEHEVIFGEMLAAGINVGQVLDAAGRSHWCLTQVARLVSRLGEVKPEDVIYLDDMFTPGYEALPYYFWQMPKERRPRIYVRNHAQSVDPDDFTFPMRAWMRRFEQMVMETCDGFILAADCHRELMHIACLDKKPIYNVGLPFDRDSVRRVHGAEVPEWTERPLRVMYSSRFDKEKQPHFFMDMIEECYTAQHGFEFVISTGSKEVRSNDSTAVTRALELEKAGKLRINRNADKQGYYRELAQCRVQLNTARQDFVSYTAIEASALGTPTLAPAFRSFPETLENRASQLYTPWSVSDAVSKLCSLMQNGVAVSVVRRLADYQHETLTRIVAIFRGEDVAAWTRVGS